MAHPTANEEQDKDVALRAAAHSRWVELRQERKPRDAERYDWIRVLLMGEELRWLDSDVFRVDRIAQALAPEGVERWAKQHKFYEGLDGLRQNLDEISYTRFRKLRTSVPGRTSRRPRIG